MPRLQTHVLVLLVGLDLVVTPSCRQQTAETTLEVKSRPVADVSTGQSEPAAQPLAQQAETQQAAPPHQAIQTVFLIVLENHNWAQIAGNTDAPYINDTLLPIASFATQYYNPPGNHPSEPNYLWLEAGTNFGITNDADPESNHQATTEHLVTLLDRAGTSWRGYFEDIDGNSCPLTEVGYYHPKHNPFVFFDDVTDTNNPQSATCIEHIRPLDELAVDLAAGRVARYNLVIPNDCHDMHTSCAPQHNRTAQGDTWLAENLPTILQSEAYANGGVVLITWDEGVGGDGPIGLIVLSPLVRGEGYSNVVHYTHSSTLRTLQEVFDVSPLLRDAANASSLSDLFTSYP